MRVVEKDQVKEELGHSPDRSDAAALTYAYDVAPGDRSQESTGHPRIQSLAAQVAESYGSGQPGTPYNPMG